MSYSKRAIKPKRMQINQLEEVHSLLASAYKELQKLETLQKDLNMKGAETQDAVMIWDMIKMMIISLWMWSNLSSIEA
jgi:hypothetical protein